MKFLILIAAAAVVMPVYSADHGSAIQRGRFGERRDFRQNRSGGNMMMRNQIFVEMQIAQKFPDEYAKVDALRKEYEGKLAELAKKASVELPASRDAAFRKLREADQKAFDAAAAKMNVSPREAMGELMALAKKHNIELFNRSGFRQGSGFRKPAAQESARVFARPDMAKLRKKYPAEMKKYDELRQTDRNKAREMLLQIIESDKSGKK
ncbi:MAG: hypothetical protein IKC82_03025 [Lentisphaeria bacterium]|nr:hypothetical protein [Lentisphaeria bacterium]